MMRAIKKDVFVKNPLMRSDFWEGLALGNYNMGLRFFGGENPCNGILILSFPYDLVASNSLILNQTAMFFPLLDIQAEIPKQQAE